jgi:lipid A 3-O-deacylase
VSRRWSTLKSAVIAAVATLAMPLIAAQAEETGHPDLVGFGGGYFDTLKNEPRNRAADFRLEYRFGDSLWPAVDEYVSIRPWAGVEFTSDGAAYGLGGILFDIPLGSSFTFTPNFGAGVYHDGDGKQLGSFWQFRSTAELSYRFSDQSRVAVSFGHISNAGLTDQNPGSEILSIYYQVPADWLFGW